jgi:uncharacterized protein YdiU (UPF0061 family)
LKTYQKSDDRDIIYDLLTLLHTNSMDFHTTFRKLCFFNPSHVENRAHIEDFASDLVTASTTKLPADSLDVAKRGLIPWFEIYAQRATLPAEVEAWKAVEVPASAEDVRLYGEVAPGDSWESKRETMMKRVNPRFVLRQWVLEETIAELERTDADGIKEGRQRLAKILDVSARFPKLNMV